MRASLMSRPSASRTEVASVVYEKRRMTVGELAAYLNGRGRTNNESVLTIKLRHLMKKRPHKDIKGIVTMRGPALVKLQ